MMSNNTCFAVARGASLAAFASLLAFVLTACCAEAPRRPITGIDTHIHIYDTSRPEGVPWPRDKSSVIFRPVLPQHFHEVTAGTRVSHTVIVEASDRVEDNQWLLDLTEGDDAFIAIVGNIEPFSPDFAEQLERYSRDPRFVGLRFRRNPPRSDYLIEPALSALKLMAKKGLTLDCLAGQINVEHAERIAAAVPDLKIVLNHLAGYSADGKPVDAEFIAKLKRAAEHPNMYCKVSGIFQQSRQRPNSPTTVDHYRPIFDALYEAFGEDRLFYGSNWPVTDLGGSYADQLRVIEDYFKAKGDDVLEKVMWKNAVRFYGLDKARR